MNFGISSIPFRAFKLKRSIKEGMSEWCRVGFQPFNLIIELVCWLSFISTIRLSRWNERRNQFETMPSFKLQQHSFFSLQTKPGSSISFFFSLDSFAGCFGAGKANEPKARKEDEIESCRGLESINSFNTCGFASFKSRLRKLKRCRASIFSTANFFSFLLPTY